MKKFIVLIFALILVLSLSACGNENSGSPADSDGNDSSTSADNGDSDTTTPPADNGSTSDESDSSANVDLTTIDGFLAAFGLTEDDLKCANFNRLDITIHSLETMEISEVSTFVSQQLTEDEIRAWLEQIMAKLNSLSDDGKVERFLGDGEALTAEYMMGEMMYIGQGTYNYNGRTVEVMISVPNGLDNEDPDSAMGACSLSLEWD